MALNFEQFEADMEKIMIKHGVSAVLIMTNHKGDLETFVGGNKIAAAGMMVVQKRIELMLDSIQNEIEEAMENAARKKE